MIVQFDEIINEVIRGLGLETESIESRVRDSIKLRTNEAQDVVFFNEDWEWRKQTFYLTTRPPFTTGTIAVTQGSKTITGTGTGWDDSLKMGYFLINNRVYKIDRVVTGTSIILKAGYDQATTSGLSYSIIFPNYYLDPRIAAIVAVKRNGINIDAIQKARLTFSMLSTGEPTQCAMDDRSEEDYYNTGSVSVTQGSNAITGVGTSFTAVMEGMPFRVNEFSKEYVVQSVTSTTALTLSEAYEGDTGTSKAYKIAPKGSQLITFRSTPNDYYFMEIEALIKAPRLINGTDISLIPNHMPLIRCAIWLAMVDLEAKNPIRIQQARADFETTLKQLKSTYRVLSNVQWRNPITNNMKRPFNPLER